MEKEKGGQFVKVEIIAQIFGISVRRVQQLTQEGVIKTTEVPGEGRRYELVPTIKTYIQYLSEKAYGKGRTLKEMELRQQKLEAEIAFKESQSEIYRIRADIAAGKFVDVAEVISDYQRFFAIFKRFAMGIPSRLVSMVSDSLEPVEIRRVEKEMSIEVKRMLGAFVVSGCTEQGENKKKIGRRSAKT